MAEKDTLVRTIGVVALLLFLAGTWWLIGKVAATDGEWNRLIYLHKGIEVIALAAAGFFFGKEVNRERAESAEETAKEATLEAKKGASGEADAEARLEDLATVVKQKKEARGKARLVTAVFADFAGRHGAQTKFPELGTFLEDRGGEFGAAKSDDDWDEVAAIADSILQKGASRREASRARVES